MVHCVQQKAGQNLQQKLLSDMQLISNMQMIQHCRQ